MSGIVSNECQIVDKGDGGDLCVEWTDAQATAFQQTINMSVFIGSSIVEGQTSKARKEVRLPYTRSRRLLTAGGAGIHFTFCNGTDRNI